MTNYKDVMVNSFEYEGDVFSLYQKQIVIVNQLYQLILNTLFLLIGNVVQKIYDSKTRVARRTEEASYFGVQGSHSVQLRRLKG